MVNIEDDYKSVQLHQLHRIQSEKFRCWCFNNKKKRTKFEQSFSMVWDWRVSRAGPMLLYWPKLLYPYYSLLRFSLLFFLSIGWHCGAEVFGLIGCISLSLSLVLPTFFNNNNNKKKWESNFDIVSFVIFFNKSWHVFK